MSKLSPEKVISVAMAELGYLEKKTNSQLEDKTDNAGKNNFTKYGRDQGCNGQPWCNAFVNWCFIKAYGKDNARLLLGGFSNYTPTSASYFKTNDRWYVQNPKISDVIFFKNDTRICHVGIVTKIENGKVYTIEGNTSGGSTLIPNGGGVFAKSYNISYSRIAGYGRPPYESLDTDFVTKTPTLKIGTKGDFVIHVQKFLAAKGYQVGNIDGVYGSQTASAVKLYQHDNGLTVDSVWGKECWKSVGISD